MSRKILNSLNLELNLNLMREKKPSIRIVLCHGVFDLVHPGHIEYFTEAKKFGDVLVVSLTSDAYVNKGPNRPFFDETKRATFLAALDFVDFVYVVQSASAIEAIRIVKPNFYVKGSDYRNLQGDITGKIIEEKVEVEKHGGELVFTDGFTSSSTKLINSSLISQDSEASKWINKLKLKFSTSDVMNWIDMLCTIEVKILGESIIDVYTDCKPLAKSSKDPILAFQKFETKVFLGGVMAIADSCSKWAKKAIVCSTEGYNSEYLTIDAKEISYEKRIISLQNRPAIIKHRFVDLNSGNRVFEYYDYDPSPMAPNVQKELVDTLDLEQHYNPLVVIADYGHGFFGEEIITTLCNSNAFLAVNTQSNAGNRGFNTFSKYHRIDFLCLNGGELELELRQKNLDYFQVVPKIMKDKGCKAAVVTLGGEGLIVFDEFGNVSRAPALANRVVDKVGAGDSVLAIASMLAFIGTPVEIIGLLSSIVAAFEVSQLGHKESLNAVNMKRYVKGLMG